MNRRRTLTLWTSLEAQLQPQVKVAEEGTVDECLKCAMAEMVNEHDTL